MPLSRVCVLFLALGGWPLAAPAQRAPSADSSQAQIQQTLRSWYFSLAHKDWNAVTEDILAAKVVAHRSPPEALLSQEAESAVVLGIPACGSRDTTLVGAAVIRRQGDWAEAWVPRCADGSIGGDSFRLIHFEQRWRFVYIDLYKEPSPLHRNISDRR